jgi:hypothetical protein
MPNQSRLGIRIGAVSSSLVLVGGLIAYRTGFLPLLSMAEPRSVDAEIVRATPLRESAEELASAEALQAAGIQPVVAASADVSQFASATARNPFPEANPGSIPVADQQASEAYRKLSELEELLNLQPPMMSSSKSIVLLDAGSAKQRAMAHLRFTELDRNRDGMLTRDESDDATWKKCLYYEIVVKDTVTLPAFQRMNAVDAAKKK